MIWLGIILLIIAASLGLLDRASTRIADCFRKAWSNLK